MIDDLTCIDTAMLMRLIIGCTALLAGVILFSALVVMDAVQRASSKGGLD